MVKKTVVEFSQDFFWQKVFEIIGLEVPKNIPSNVTYGTTIWRGFKVPARNNKLRFSGDSTGAIVSCVPYKVLAPTLNKMISYSKKSSIVHFASFLLATQSHMFTQISNAKFKRMLAHKLFII